MSEPETPIWSNETVRLVAPDATDAPLVAAWWSDRAVMERNVPTPLAPKSLGEITFRIQQRINDPDEWYWMIVAIKTNQRIGTISLQVVNRLARVGRLGLLIGSAAYRGRGYGSAALTLMLRFAFQELDLQRVELNVLGNNAAAIRLYRRLGFRHEGALRSAVYRQGQRLDWLQMGLLREEWDES